MPSPFPGMDPWLESPAVFPDIHDALIFLLKHYSGDSHINVGYGEDVTIDELARKVMAAVGYAGTLEHDRSKPDGTPRKLMSSARLAAMGWTPQIPLEQGLASTYAWFKEQKRGALRA